MGPNVSIGEPGSPIPPPAGGFGRAQPLRRGIGKPGFPIPPPGGRVWKGEALPGSMFIPSGCGASRMDGYREHRLSKRVWGHRVSPRPRPAGEWGHRVSPFPHPWEGLGGRSPPKNNLMFIAALCGGAAWTADTILDCRCWIVDCLAGRHRAIQHFDECGMFNRKWYEMIRIACAIVTRQDVHGGGVLIHPSRGSLLLHPP